MAPNYATSVAAALTDTDHHHGHHHTHHRLLSNRSLSFTATDKVTNLNGLDLQSSLANSTDVSPYIQSASSPVIPTTTTISTLSGLPAHGTHSGLASNKSEWSTPATYVTSTSVSVSYSSSNASVMAPIEESSQSSSIVTLATNLVSNLFGMSKPNRTHTPPTSIRSHPQIFLYDDTSSDSSESVVDLNVTSFFANKPADSSTSTAIFTEGDIDQFDSLCYSSLEDYELLTSMLCSSLLVLGVVYFTYGFRCFRAVAFFTGLVFGTALAYAVCTAEHLAPFVYGNLVVALATGLLVGLLTMLVTYIGLFVIGLHLGLLLGAALLFVIYLLRPYFEVLQPPLSALTLLIFFVAVSLVGALSTIYFSKGCTIIASSLYGSALTLLCADYFVENFKIIHWFLDNLSNGDDWYGLLAQTRRGQYLCLGSQIVLVLWPLLTLFGIIVQSCITAKGVQYRSGYGMVATSPTLVIGHPVGNACVAKGQSASGHHNRCKNPEEARLEQKHRKYRYLYQVRTAHGDVISQHYLQSLQNKKLCLSDQDSLTFNSDLSSHFFPSESRTTTLSVA